MSTLDTARTDALPVVALLTSGAIALVAGVAVGGEATAFGAFLFFAATLLALGSTKWELLTWPNVLVAFIAVLWLIPIRLYRLPVALPFHLELYRVLILVLVGGFVVWSLREQRTVQAFQAGKPLFVLTAVVLASQVVNAPTIDVPGSEGQALKSLSLFLSYVIVFLLFSSTLDTLGDIDLVVKAVVVGAVVVAVAALYEGATNFNVFNHLSDWLPGFARNERDVFEARGGRLRVHASAQHPIALGAALMMVLPFVVYLIARAQTLVTRGVWVACLAVIVGASAATISRTTVGIGVAMIIVAYVLRRRLLVRLVPLVLVLPVFVHAVAPGAMGGLLKSFGDQQGTTFINSFYGRAGESGSGRLADIAPAFDLWSSSPIIGLGLDSPQIVTTGADIGPGPPVVVPLIFDNQYLHTLVTLGLVGIIGLMWLVWGLTARFMSEARDLIGPHGDLVAACAAACAGYGTSMLFYDSLAYVQVTLLLFIVGAVGLKTIALARSGEEQRTTRVAARTWRSMPPDQDPAPRHVPLEGEVADRD